MRDMAAFVLLTKDLRLLKLPPEVAAGFLSELFAEFIDAIDAAGVGVAVSANFFPLALYNCDTRMALLPY